MRGNILCRYVFHLVQNEHHIKITINESLSRNENSPMHRKLEQFIIMKVNNPATLIEIKWFNYFPKLSKLFNMLMMVQCKIVLVPICALYTIKMTENIIIIRVRCSKIKLASLNSHLLAECKIQYMNLSIDFFEGLNLIKLMWLFDYISVSSINFNLMSKWFNA